MESLVVFGGNSIRLIEVLKLLLQAAKYKVLSLFTK